MVFMVGNRTQNKTNDRNEGYFDTREQNLVCENKDLHPGCDMGIDEAG
jgi:hypothetical protein